MPLLKFMRIGRQVQYYTIVKLPVMLKVFELRSLEDSYQEGYLHKPKDQDLPYNLIGIT